MVQGDGVAVTLIAIVHGAITSCDGSRYPSIFTRINHPSILNWIYKTVGFLDIGKYLLITSEIYNTMKIHKKLCELLNASDN